MRVHITNHYYVTVQGRPLRFKREAFLLRTVIFEKQEQQGARKFWGNREDNISLGPRWQAGTKKTQKRWKPTWRESARLKSKTGRARPYNLRVRHRGFEKCVGHFVAPMEHQQGGQGIKDIRSSMQAMGRRSSTEWMLGPKMFKIIEGNPDPIMEEISSLT